MNQDNPFGNCSVPAPPGDLRAKALEAAAAAEPVSPEPGLWTRLSESRAVQLAWAASLVMLAGAHLWLSVSPARSVQVADQDRPSVPAEPAVKKKPREPAPRGRGGSDLALARVRQDAFSVMTELAKEDEL